MKPTFTLIQNDNEDRVRAPGLSRVKELVEEAIDHLDQVRELLTTTPMDFDHCIRLTDRLAEIYAMVENMTKPFTDGVMQSETVCLTAARFAVVYADTIVEVDRSFARWCRGERD